MIEIALTQGRVALIDDEDFDMISRYKWFAHFNKCTRSFYAETHIPHPLGGKNKNNKTRRTILRMHRLILDLKFGDDFEVDHINHDTLDNRRSNLRIVTRAENGRNRIGPNLNNTSGFLGVYWHKQTQKWQAQIKVNGKLIHLGIFDDLAEAAAARDIAALHLHREFATLNNRAMSPWRPHDDRI